MRLLFTFLLMILSTTLIANPVSMAIKPNKVPPDTKIKTFSRFNTDLTQMKDQKLAAKYPTQVVRLRGDISKNGMNCSHVFSAMDTLINRFLKEDIFYKLMGGCFIIDLDAKRVGFFLDGYFGPANDSAVDAVTTFIANYNGTDFVGTPFEIESSKGVVSLLNISAGINPIDPEDSGNLDMEVLNQFKQNLYFDTMYEFNNNLYTDVFNQLATNNFESIKAFFEKWLPEHRLDGYLEALPESNHVRVNIEPILLMDKEPKIFTPFIPFILGFDNDCSQYPGGKCLS